MKLATETNLVQSNLSTEAIEVGVDWTQAAQLMKLLSNIYSNSPLAVVREYSCNARDSHVEAGNTGPIFVTSPTRLEPTFTVQDFGLGLDRKGVIETFGTYLLSTKRDNDDLIGAMGIGSKSAWTISPQFIVTGIKNGEKTVALFALDDNDKPTINVIFHGETDEPNGVKVEVGIENLDAIHKSIKSLFYTWQSGTVLVDGVEPLNVWPTVKLVQPGVYLGWNRDNDASPLIIVMGGVSYNLPNGVRNKLSQRQQNLLSSLYRTKAQVVFDVAIGDVHITPSREDLRDTKRTVETLSKLIDRFHLALTGWVSDQIDAEPTFFAAAIKRREIHQQMGTFLKDILEGVTYRGKSFGLNEIFVPQTTVFSMRKPPRAGYRSKVRTCQNLGQWGVSAYGDFEKYIVVTNVPDRRIRSVQIAAKAYLTAPGRDQVGVVAYAGDSFEKDWFAFGPGHKVVETIDFEQFLKFWKPKAATSSGNAPSYSVYGQGDSFSVEELNDLEVIVFPREDWAALNTYNLIVAKTLKQYSAVYLEGAQTLGAFMKRVPEARNGNDVIREVAKEAMESLSQDDYNLMEAENILRDIDQKVFRWLIDRESRITNPKVKTALSVYRFIKSIVDSQSKRQDEINSLRMYVGIPKGAATLKAEGLKGISEALPLLKMVANLSSYNLPQYNIVDDLIAYVNSAKL